MTSLAVDKIKTRVSLSLADRSQVTGYMFLSPYSELGVGQQTVLEALTGQDRFIPFETTEGEFSFINQSQVVWLSRHWEESESRDEDEPEVERRNVTVMLRDGKMLRGEVVIIMPEGQARLSDWLNRVGRFFSLKDKDREVMINTDFVVRIS
jgi:hypothetical protein